MRGCEPPSADCYDELGCVDEALAAETHLAFVTERIRALLGRAASSRPGSRPSRDLAEQARAILDARLFEPVTMAALAAELGTGPTHVARAFSEAFGIPPHRYVLGRRLDAARDRDPRRPISRRRGGRSRLQRSGPPHAQVPGLPRYDAWTVRGGHARTGPSLPAAVHDLLVVRARLVVRALRVVAGVSPDPRTAPGPSEGLDRRLASGAHATSPQSSPGCGSGPPRW